MKIYLLVTALSVMALSTANVQAAMPLTDLIGKSTAYIEGKPATRNAALSTITLQTYDICVPLILTLMAGEVHGAVYSTDTANTYGILWGALNTWGHAQVARGMPQDVLDRTWQPYQNESMSNQMAYISKYAQYCAKEEYKFIKAAGLAK